MMGFIWWRRTLQLKMAYTVVYRVLYTIAQRGRIAPTQHKEREYWGPHRRANFNLLDRSTQMRQMGVMGWHVPWHTAFHSFSLRSKAREAALTPYECAFHRSVPSFVPQQTPNANHHVFLVYPVAHCTQVSFSSVITKSSFAVAVNRIRAPISFIFLPPTFRFVLLPSTASPT